MRSIIERHPLRDCYMLYSKLTPRIPPYFGTLRQCKKAQIFFEKKLEEMFQNQNSPMND